MRHNKMMLGGDGEFIFSTDIAVVGSGNPVATKGWIPTARRTS